MEGYDNPNKVFVEVTVKFDTDGHKRPLSFLWEDGTSYEIERLLDVRRAASLKAGGFGNRYTIQVQGRIRYLFEDDDRWYIERKE